MFLNLYRGLPRSVYALFGARIVNRMGDFVRTFLTLYLTRALGLPTALSGTFVMLSAMASSVGAFAAGHFVDSYGRRRIILTSQLASALLIGSCGFLPTGTYIPWLLIAGTFFMGAIRPAVNAVVADITEADRRQSAYGLLYLGTNIGVAVGPMIAGFLFHHYIRWIFIGDAVSTLIAMAVVFSLVPETIPHAGYASSGNTPDIEDLERPERGTFLSILLRRPQLLVFALLGVCINLIYSQHSFALPLYLDSLFGGAGAAQFGLLMSFNAVTVLVATTLVLGATARFPASFNMGLGALCYLTGFGMLAFVSAFTSFGFFFLSTCIWTVGEILVVTNYQVFVASNTPLTHRGRFNGTMNLSFGIGNMLGPPVAGFFLAHVLFSSFWLFVAGASLIVATGYYLLYLRTGVKRRAA
ncbi:MFS transporter [Sediminispirochaeta bajacaliforniensis]|uniref:MFS transporter n=1 Tax=Sediminispirochaeta bajacaliforniensis TaxID=148 RepID=UPI000374764B|nr:MFS transporter [Sediminispirochaeta bajacaliforniensis]